MGGIKQEQSDASQQLRASHSMDQPQEEVGTSDQGNLFIFKALQFCFLTWRNKVDEVAMH